MKESQFGMNTVEEILAEGGAAFSSPQQRRPKMAYEHEEGKVSLFKNDKGDNEKRPDYTGKCMVKGEMLHLSMWESTSKGGTKYLSGNIAAPWNGGESSSASSASVDDVPW